MRPKFRAPASADEVRACVEALATEGVGCDDPVDVPTVTADSDDDYLVALALAAEADGIVSGDKHLPS
jgi:predicted nucleic acid-binding protein